MDRRRHRASPPQREAAPEREIDPFVAKRPEPYHGAALMPSPEDFAAWCDHPVTRFVATAFRDAALVQKQAWTDASWKAGKADALQLAELRTRADAYNAMFQTTLPQFAEFIKRAKDL